MRNFSTSFKNTTAISTLIIMSALPPLTQAADEGETTDSFLEEIIVTASKREQSLQTVAMGISALSEAELDKRGVDDIGEFFRTVPGIQYTDFGATGRRGERKVTIRGISGTALGGPLVGYYIDETPIPVSDPTLFDIQRIEVLRGPQGTLYGSGTAGGTIKIITNKPDTSQFSGKIDGTLSTTENGGENYAIKAMVNLPVVADKMAVRVVGYYEDNDGFIDSLVAPAGSLPEEIINSQTVAKDNFNDVERRGVRATIQITPTENLTITPSLAIHRTDMGGEANHFPTLGDLQIIREIDTFQVSNFDLYNLTIDYDFGNVSFLSTTSYFKGFFEGQEDVTNENRLLLASVGLKTLKPNAFVLDTTKKEWTQEFRLMSTGDSRLQWTGGLYYHKLDLIDNSVGVLEDVGLFVAPDFIIFDEAVLFGAEVNIDTEEYAAFGEAYYDVTEQLKVTVGARWYDYTLTQQTDAFGLIVTGSGDPSITVVTGPMSTNNESISPKISIAYQATEDHMIYVNAAKGFRTGGVSNGVGNLPSCNDALAELGLTEAPEGFEADTIWNYEAGVKTSWADGRFTVNMSAFYIDWNNIAQSVNLATVGVGNESCAFTIVINAGQATSKGFEFESQINPVEGLNFGVAIAYTDATLGANPTVGSEGDRLIAVPEWTVSLSGEYEFPLSDSLDGFVRADYQHVGEVSFGFNEGEVFDAYGLTNLRVGVRSESWTVSLFINNVTDSRPELGERNFGSVFRRFTTLRPRTYGLNLSTNF